MIPVSVFLHRRRHRLAAVDGAHQVCVEDRLDVARGAPIDGALFDTSVIAPPALLTRMSTRPQFLLYRLDRFLSSVPIGYVNLQAEALHAMRLQFLRPRVRPAARQTSRRHRGRYPILQRRLRALPGAEHMRGPGHAPLPSRSQLFLGGSWITAQWICSPERRVS